MKKTYTKLRLLTGALGLLAFSATAQISGTVTINQLAPAAATNYTSFAQLAATLNAGGINGPLTVDVVANSGPYAEQFIFNQITGANASNRIVINGNNNLVTFTGTNAAQPSIIGMNGADFFTFNNLNVQGTGTWAYCAMLYNGANFNVFSACTFSVPFNTTTTLHIPVVFSGSGTSYATAGNSGNGNRFTGCTMYSGYAGIWLYGLTSAPFTADNTIENCNISDFFYCGVYSYYTSRLTLRNNILERLTRTLFTTTYGTFFIYNSGLMCDGNQYRRMFDANTTAFTTCYPIFGYYSPTANNPEVNTVRNNMIYDIRSNGTIYAIYYYYMNGNIYNNTISLDHAGATSGTTWGVYTYGGPGYPVDMKNNIISITRGGTGQKVGIYIPLSGNITSDRNDIYVASASGATNTAYFTPSFFPSLAAYQAASSLDATSFSIDPVFSNVTNSLYPTAVALNDQAIPLGIVYDATVAIRNQVTPDIGALEFLTPNCAGTPSTTSVSQPTYQICPGEDVQLGLTSLSSAAGLTYQWNVSTVSNVGPWTPIANANGPFYVAPGVSANSFYQVVQTCTLPGGGAMNAVGSVSVALPTTTVVPYLEGFEGIGMPNRLPNCSWSSTSMGGANRTYVNAQSANRAARNGSSFANFDNSTVGTSAYFTNAITMNAGITYSAAIWYATEYFGYNNWTNLSIFVGPNQSATGQTLVASVGPVISGPYKLLDGLFTVPTSGNYHISIRATSSAGLAQYLNIDDMSITIPCTPLSGNSPSVVTSVSSTTICAGQPLSLTASGANTYSWSTGAAGASTSDSPLTAGTASYYVTGTNTLTGCQSQQLIQVQVDPSPNVIVMANPPIVCAGSNVVMTGFGAVSYAWSNGVTGQNVSVNPTANTTYTVIGTNAIGCSGTFVQSITVKPLPVVSAVSNNGATACKDDVFTVTANGGVSYQWYSNTSSNILVGSPISVQASASTIFTVMATGSNGCVGKAQVTQEIEACTGIAKIATLGGVNVYPNPTSGILNVEFNSNISKSVSVIDVTGRVIMTTNSSDSAVALDLANLAAGVYYVKMQTATATEVVKVVKQ
jgi:parallel beta-helix repeat protein